MTTYYELVSVSFFQKVPHNPEVQRKHSLEPDQLLPDATDCISRSATSSNMFPSINQEFDRIPEHMPNRWGKTCRKQVKKATPKIYTT